MRLQLAFKPEWDTPILKCEINMGKNKLSTELTIYSKFC